MARQFQSEFDFVCESGTRQYALDTFYANETSGSSNTYNETMSAGAVVGSTAIRSLISTITPSGGAVLGSSAIQSIRYNPTVSGGAVCGSSALSSIVIGVSGGGVLGSSATTAAIYNLTTSGGGVLGSSAVPSIIYNVTTSGGGVCGSSALSSIVIGVSGGAVLGSSAIIGVTYNINPSGGAVVGGSARIISPINITMSGGAVVGGSAIETFIDAPNYDHTCPCNTVTYYGSGGFVLGSSATITDNIVRGGAVCGGSAKVTTSTNVWDDFACVYTLSESGDGTDGEFIDSTPHHLNGTGGAGIDITTVPTQDDGVGCQYSNAFDGRDWINTSPDDLTTTQAFTISCWAKIDSFGKARTFYSRGFDDADSHFVVSLDHTFLNQVSATVQTIDTVGTVTTNVTQGSTTLERDWWYHFACVFNPGSSLDVYVNGVLHKSRAVTGTTTTTNDTGNYIGRRNAANCPIGNIQEVRLSAVARSADWLLAEYDDYCGNLYYVGSETETSHY